MPTELDYFRGQPASRDRRFLGRVEVQRRRRLAVIDATAEIEAARLDGVAYVGKVAMHNATLLSQLELELTALVPTAASRVVSIANIASLAMAEIVTDAARRLR